MDNLCISCAFIEESLDHEKKVMVEGFCRKEKHGVLCEIMQDDMPAYKKKKLVEAVGTLQAAVIYPKNHPNHTVVVMSLCDKKPVYIMSSVAESIEWNKKNKKI